MRSICAILSRFSKKFGSNEKRGYPPHRIAFIADTFARRDFWQIRRRWILTDPHGCLDDLYRDRFVSGQQSPAVCWNFLTYPILHRLIELVGRNRRSVKSEWRSVRNEMMNFKSKNAITRYLIRGARFVQTIQNNQIIASLFNFYFVRNRSNVYAYTRHVKSN